jgi:peptidyl-tRNA hydrolase
MENIVGIFRSVTVAEQAVNELVSRDMPSGSFTVLSTAAPQSLATRTASEQTLENIRTTGKEPAGAGKETGTALGAAIGGTAGFTAGATAATLMVPGLGAIFAIGLGAAALLGLGGAAAAAKVGDTIDRNVDTGASQSQVDLYRRLLRSGMSLVIAQVRSGAEISMVHEVFQQLGSEDVETARRKVERAA